MPADFIPIPFTVKIRERTLTRYVEFPDLVFTLEQPYTYSDDRGPNRCIIRATGNLEALNQLTLYMRGGVEVYDGSADPCFWGYIHTVLVTCNKIKYGFTLDGMGNKIDIAYILQTVNQQYSGSGSRADTGFGSSADSIADYGTMEKRLRIGRASAAGALLTRATRLDELDLPIGLGPDVSGDGSFSAVIEVRSWIETLDWPFYENSSGNAAGFEQNAVISSEATQKLGFGMAFTKVQFIRTSLFRAALILPDCH
jgi:hypothetical protein